MTGLLGQLFFQVARNTSRRGGESLAKAMASRIQKIAEKNPKRPPVEYWEEALEARPGWRRVRSYLYQFRTGDRLEFRVDRPAREWLARMTQIEVGPLGKGMKPEVQEELVKEAVAAATAWWEKNAQ